jgi:hypothetical protein
MASNPTTELQPPGYPSHAKFITTSPDCAVFGKFTELNVRDLLYQQSKILDLEEQLFKHNAEDVTSQFKVPLLSATSYRHMKRSQNMDPTRLELVLKIRISLKIYSIY